MRLIDIFEALKQLTTVLIGAAFIVTATICVAELSARISARSFLDSKIDRVEKTIAAQSGSLESTGSNKISSTQDYGSELSSYILIIEDIQHLTFTGAENSRQTIHAIRHRISEISQIRSAEAQVQTQRARVQQLQSELEQFQLEDDRLAQQIVDLRQQFEEEIAGLGETRNAGLGPVADRISQNIRQAEFNREANQARIDSINAAIEEGQKEIEIILSGSQVWQPSTYVHKNFLLYLQSDMLLALLVTCCGGIGAIFTASRSKKPKFLSPIFNGIMAGFVAFLVLKGGRFLFVVDISGTQVSFVNPYAAAFAGVLAGLFTEKAYRVLSEFADQIGDKIVGDKKE